VVFQQRQRKTRIFSACTQGEKRAHPWVMLQVVFNPVKASAFSPALSDRCQLSSDLGHEPSKETRVYTSKCGKVYWNC